MSTLAAALILAGALLAFGGALGLVRLKTFYESVHPPTMGTTLGTALILAGAMLASALESGPVARYVLIGAFMLVTTPISYLLLLAAARRRRRLDAGTGLAAEGAYPEKRGNPTRRDADA